MQFKVIQQSEETNINVMQEAELRQQLSNWKIKYEETKQKYEETAQTLNTYKQESSSDNEKREILEKELENLELALGKTDVEGQGVVITLTEKEPHELIEDEQVISITAKDLIYMINYLKDAGAEAISINDKRIVNTTDIADIVEGETLKINGEYIRTSTFVLKAIGNSSYLESSLFGKGGYVEQLNTTGINAKIEKYNKIKILKYDKDFEVKYMKEKEIEEKDILNKK